MTINDILMYASGFLWGWLFIPFMILAAKFADFLNDNYAADVTKQNLWIFKSITFISVLMFLATTYWMTSRAFIEHFFSTSGREFGISLLVGFLGFVLLPRFEAKFKKNGERTGT